MRRTNYSKHRDTTCHQRRELKDPISVGVLKIRSTPTPVVRLRLPVRAAAGAGLVVPHPETGGRLPNGCRREHRLAAAVEGVEGGGSDRLVVVGAGHHGIPRAVLHRSPAHGCWSTGSHTVSCFFMFVCETRASLSRDLFKGFFGARMKSTRRRAVVAVERQQSVTDGQTRATLRSPNGQYLCTHIRVEGPSLTAHK